jgi:membrane fusion protein (multidrug efflux system)
MTHPFIVYTANFVFFLLLISCNSKNAKPQQGGGAPQAGPLPVEVIVLKSEKFAQSIETSGTIIPDEETELKSEMAGRIIQLNLPEGKAVSKGTLLVKLYDEDLKAQKAKLKAQLDIEKRTLERLAKLKSVQGIAEQEYDLAESRVVTLEAELKLLLTQLDRTEIRAPFDGVVGLRMVSPGAYLSPGTSIATLRKVNPLKIDFNIAEKYAALVIPGSKVRCLVEGIEQEFMAEVLASDKSIDQTTRNLKLRARLINPPDNILPGAFARVFIDAERASSSIFVPTQAVIPQARTNSLFLYKNGKAFKQQITTGVRRARQIQVQEGVLPGDTVILTGILFLRPEMPVTIKSVVVND